MSVPFKAILVARFVHCFSQVSSFFARWGILLSVKRGGKQRLMSAKQVWANDEDSANVTVLNVALRRHTD
jgi:hypothetical protein